MFVTPPTKQTTETSSTNAPGTARPRAIPQAANFLVTEENVHTAIVYGLLRKDDGSESLIGSLRTNKSSLSPDQFLKGPLAKDVATELVVAIGSS